MRFGQRKSTEPRLSNSSGLRPPSSPPVDLDGYGIALFYLTHFEAEFARARQVDKLRASHALIASSSATALIAVVGAATTTTGWAWLGIVSAALAGCVTVVNAWDGLFRHRDLWHHRSLVLGELQEAKRNFEVRAANGEDRGALAADALAALNQILANDRVAWSELRQRSQPERSTRTLPSES